MTVSSPSSGRTASLLGWCLAVAVAALTAAPAVAGPGTPAPDPVAEQRVTFLTTASVVGMKRLDIGITGSSRATLRLGADVHDAHFQAIDDRKAIFEGVRGTELNFRDAWQYNLAAYHLDRLLGLDMVPVTVERTVRGKRGALTWWIDDVLMLEADRYAKKVTAPDLEGWNRQMWTLRVFDQLIANTDRNLRNVVIDTRWKLWMIDHTRAFRRAPALASSANLTRIDRRLLARLRALTREEVAAAIGAWVGAAEIEALMARRALIVAHFDAAGETALFDAAAP
jgi:hypothetical protein